jgi:hypothetical protein
MQAGTVSFTDVGLFGKGFKASRSACECVAGRVLLTWDGPRCIQDVTSLADLWSLVYVLWCHNKRTHPVFRALSDPQTGRANASRFVAAVRLVFEGNTSPVTHDRLRRFLRWVWEHRQRFPLAFPWRTYNAEEASPDIKVRLVWESRP